MEISISFLLAGIILIITLAACMLTIGGNMMTDGIRGQFEDVLPIFAGGTSIAFIIALTHWLPLSFTR